MAVLALAVTALHEEPPAPLRRPASKTAAAAQAAPPAGEARLDPARGSRFAAPAATPFEAVSCLFPITGAGAAAAPALYATAAAR